MTKEELLSRIQDQLETKDKTGYYLTNLEETILQTLELLLKSNEPLND